MRERDIEIWIILNYFSGDESLGISSFAADIRLTDTGDSWNAFFGAKFRAPSFSSHFFSHYLASMDSKPKRSQSWEAKPR